MKLKNPLSYIKQLFDDARAFMGKVMSASTDESSKRFIMIGSFFILCVLALINQIFGLSVDQSFIYVFAGLAGFSAYMTIKDKKLGQ